MSPVKRTVSRGSQNLPGRPTANDNVSQYRVVLLGEAGVGKTSIVLRFVEGRFFQKLESTIGAAFSSQIVRVDDRLVKFEIWDTAGQERYQSLAPMYYRGAQAALIVYDITDANSFRRAKVWAEELHQQNGKHLTVGVLGNKADTRDKRAVEFPVGESFADENGYMFRETSAKTGQNVDEAFHELARRLPAEDDKPPQNTIRPAKSDDEKRRHCCKT